MHAGVSIKKYIYSFLLLCTMFTSVIIIAHGHGCGHGSGGGRGHSSSARGSLRGYRNSRGGSDVQLTTQDKIFLQEVMAPMIICLALGGIVFILLVRRRMRRWIGYYVMVIQDIVPGETGEVEIQSVGAWSAQSKCAGETCSTLRIGTRVKIVDTGWYYVIVECVNGNQDH